MTQVQEEEIRALMSAWINAERSRIWERSGDISGDMTSLRSDALQRCERLGIWMPIHDWTEIEEE